jgi:hypothetical protein
MGPKLVPSSVISPGPNMVGAGVTTAVTVGGTYVNTSFSPTCLSTVTVTGRS